MSIGTNAYRLLRYQASARAATPSGAATTGPASAPTPAALGADLNQLQQLQQKLALVQQECKTLMDTLSKTPTPAAPPAPAPKPAANQAPKPAPKPAALPAPKAAPAPAPKPAPAPAPKPAPAPATYTVQSGDTLSGIAGRTLGNSGRWTDIYNLNRDQISNPNVIHPGQVLKLPSGSNPVPAPAPSSNSAPSGPAPTGSVGSWISQAMAILEQNGVSASKLNANDINTIIQHESSGNPRAQNNWDSNAAAGHPSKGLMQTIDSTFSAYALPGHTDIWNPVDNIIAGVRYAISRYGSIQNVPGIKALAAGRSYVGY